jgi:glucokinase
MLLALDIGGTKSIVATADERGHMVRRVQNPTPFDLQEGLELLKNMAREVAGNEKILAIGVSAGGPMDYKNGIISPLHQPQWRDVPLRQIFEDEFGAPLRVEVDTDAAALAEWNAGEKASRLLYVTLSTGCGAGFLMDGEIYRGADGVHPEYAHMTIAADVSTHICECGAPGCLSQLVSGRGIEKIYGKSARDLDKSQWCEVGKHLGEGLRNWSAVLSPDVIVLGGGVAVGGADLLLRPAEKTMRDGLRLTPAPQIKLSRLGYDTALRGAVALAMRTA